MPTNEEQMLRRQSAPQQTPLDYLNTMQTQSNGAVNGMRVLSNPIGTEAVHKAMLTLQKYKEGKTNLERKIVENEKWYKLRNWECMRSGTDDIKPVSAWLFNAIANKHADAMDNFPSPNILPREQGDQGTAKMLSSVIPVVLDQCEFEKVYSEAWMYKLKTGTCVYGVFWDGSKLNGLGDIAIKKIDILNLFWEPGITDIQDSRNIFSVELVDNDVLAGQYPELAGKLGGGTIDIAKYVYDDKVDTSEKSVVVDWYYKRNAAGRTILHYVKFCNDTVLFATENDPNYAEVGFYDHGMYPFVFDTLFPIEGTPAGFGYIDVGKDAQAYIDRGNQAILENLLSNAKPRYFFRNDGSVNEDEFIDMSKDLVHVDGNIDDNSIRPIQGKALSDIYVSVINNKIDELKETTGNRDISTGGTTSGVTAASAIAAMQEAGSKLSRDNIKASYRAFRNVVYIVIELIRQFYDLPRTFRIIGENGAMQYIQFSNAGLTPQSQGMNEFGVEVGERLPVFDIEVTAQKQSPYSKMAQNELALQFYNVGFFNPAMADQALACLDMMDFDRKDFVVQKIIQNAMMYQQAMAMQAQKVQQQQASDPNVEDKEALGGEPGAGESSNTEKARQRVADSTAPR